MSFEKWATEQITLTNSGVALQKPSPHTSMFKYISLHSNLSWGFFERTLNELDLVGSTVKKLNDPFEGEPNILNDLRPKLVAEINDHYENAERILGNEFNPEKKYKNLEPHISKATKIIKGTIKKSRIISFCERSDSPLLWSHYANSYKGACFHFLGRAFLANQRRLGYVSYSNHRPICPMSLALRLSNRKSSSSKQHNHQVNIAELIRFCFFTKASDWAYENEIRLVYDAKKQDSASFNLDGLVSIIIGPKMDPDDILKLKSIVKNSVFPNLPIRSSRLSSNSFSVEIEDIK